MGSGSRKVRRAGAVAVATVVVVLGVAWSAPAAAAATPPATATPAGTTSTAADWCATARELVEQSYPQQALAGLVAAGEAAETRCPDAKGRAALAVHAAAAKASQAQDLLAEGDRAAARAAAQASLAIDRDNADAADVLEALASGGPSGPEKRADEVADFTTAYLEPLQQLLLPLLAVLAAVLVAARLLALTPVPWPRFGSGVEVSGQRLGLARRAVLALGILTAAFAGLLLAVGLADAVSAPLSPAMAWALVLTAVCDVAGVSLLVLLIGPTRSDGAQGLSAAMERRAVGRSLALGGGVLAVAAVVGVLAQAAGAAPLGTAAPLVLVGGVVAAVLAAGLLAVWVATRLRVRIEVSDDAGATSTARAAHVAAMLSQLGAAPPEGLEVPVGIDATDLSDAITSLPAGGPVAKVIASLVPALFGTTPWRVLVREPRAGTVAVSITRNGRPKGAAVISAPRLGAAASAGSDPAGTDEAGSPGLEPTRDVDRMVAAYVLLTLSPEHGGFDGLAGTTSWEALGLQYIATTGEPGALAEGEQRALLSRAANLDPASCLVAYALQHSLWRSSTAADELRRYRDWLSTFALTSDLPPGLRLRADYTSLVVATNCAFASGADDDRTRARDLGDSVSQRLRDSSDPLAGSLREAATGVVSLWKRTVPRGDPTSPNGAYNLACLYASRHDLEGLAPPGSNQGPDDEEAVRLLDIAVLDDDLRTWMSSDPQLAGFRTRAPFRRRFLPSPAPTSSACPRSRRSRRL